MPVTPTDCTARLCYLAALLGVAGGVLLIIARVKEATGRHPSGIDHMFDTKEIDSLWRARHSHAALSITGNLIEVLAMLLTAPAVMVLVESIGVANKGAGSSRLLIPCYTIALFVTILDFLFATGARQTTNWMIGVLDDQWDKWYPNIATPVNTSSELVTSSWGPMQTIEVSFIMQAGQRFWVSVLDELLLSMFFIIIGCTTMCNQALVGQVIHRAHSILSMAIGVVMFTSFWFGVLRLVSFPFFHVLQSLCDAGAMLVLVPIWAIALGRHLPYLADSVSAQKDTAAGYQVETEMRPPQEM